LRTVLNVHNRIKANRFTWGEVHQIDLGKDSYPFACLVSSKESRLYVSLWNKAAIAVIDLKTRKVIKTWLKNEVLEERKYYSDERREECTGLFGNPAKRPGVCPNG
jgi:hypothetical protein